MRKVSLPFGLIALCLLVLAPLQRAHSQETRAARAGAASERVQNAASELVQTRPPASGARRVWKSAFELAFGEYTPYGEKFPDLYGLPYEKNLAITREVLDYVVAVALKEAGARRLRLAYLPGGFQEFPVVPSAQLETITTVDGVEDAMNIIGYLAQQTAVIASTHDERGTAAALHIVQKSGRDLAAPAAVEKFWRRLSALEPKLNPGFSATVGADRRPGLYIIDTEGDWPHGDAHAFDAAVASVSNEFKIETTVTHLRVNYLLLGNDWKQHHAGEQYLARLAERGRRRLVGRLRHVYRPRVERRIEQAFKRHAPRAAARRSACRRLDLISRRRTQQPDVPEFVARGEYPAVGREGGGRRLGRLVED